MGENGISGNPQIGISGIAITKQVLLGSFAEVVDWQYLDVTKLYNLVTIILVTLK